MAESRQYKANEGLYEILIQHGRKLDQANDRLTRIEDAIYGPPIPGSNPERNTKLGLMGRMGRVEKWVLRHPILVVASNALMLALVVVSR